MPKKNDIWNEAFNNPDLSSEDWLEPSSTLFDKIEKDLIPRKNKRRFGYIPFLLGFIIAIFVGAIYFYDFEEVVKNELFVQSEFIDSKISSNAINDKLTSIVSVQENVSESSKHFLTYAEKGSENISPITQNKLAKRIDQLEPTKKISKSSYSSVNTESNFLLPISSEDLNTSLAIVKENLPVVLSNSRNLSILNLLDDYSVAIEMPERRFSISPLFVTGLHNAKDRNTVSLFTGVSTWDFRLNNNYLTALDPADFTFEEGNGKTMALSFERPVRNKISLLGSVSWDRVIAYSGHNSNINYELQNEAGDFSNTLDLTMASPFGLLQSDVVVSRNAAVSADQTSLVLDLHNRHQFDNISVSTGLAYMLIENSGFEISTNMGLGLNYIVGLENELESFDLSSSDFSSGRTIITQDQQAVNKLTTQFNLGLKLRRSIGENTLLGVSVDYVRGLSDVYREDDFSSRLSARRYKLSLSRRF